MTKYTLSDKIYIYMRKKFIKIKFKGFIILTYIFIQNLINGQRSMHDRAHIKI